MKSLKWWNVVQGCAAALLVTGMLMAQGIPYPIDIECAFCSQYLPAWMCPACWLLQ